MRTAAETRTAGLTGSARRGPRWRRRLTEVAALTVALVGTALWPVAPAQAALRCAALDRPVSDQLNPRSQAQLLTYRTAEADTYRRSGFSHGRGSPFTVAAATGSGLSAVHRLYRKSNGNFFYSTEAAEIANAVTRLGYRDQGTAFYASRTPADCLVPIYSLFKNGVHRFSTTPGERTILRDAGWALSPARFYVGRPTTDSTFSIGVMPDTQQEVHVGDDPRFLNRSTWLVSSRSALDLRFVTHTGDITDWDTPDHVQYLRAQAALAPLEAAGLPYSLSPGNHDTDAVCTGGGACDPSRTRVLVRQTPSFNTYLADGTADLAGRFEAGKVDNTFSTFAAGGVPWLVLNLELWPRPAALEWAKGVVAAHPHHNVIVVTHSYLTASGTIGTTGSYGDSSPQQLFDELIKVYPNVRIVLSGHVGSQASRTDTGIHGNRIVSLLLTMHDNRTNPVRLMEVNTAANSLDTWVYGPFTGARHPTYSKHVEGLAWVR